MTNKNEMPDEIYEHIACAEWFRAPLPADPEWNTRAALQEPQGDLVLCRRMVREPEHDGATGYEYFIPVKDAQPVDLDALKREIEYCLLDNINPHTGPLPCKDTIVSVIDHLASRGMIVTAQQPTEDAQRALDMIFEIFEAHCENLDIDMPDDEDEALLEGCKSEIRAALARGLGE